VVVVDIFTIVTVCMMYVYDVGKTIFDNPTRGTDVLTDPPTAVTLIKFVGGFRYQGDDGVLGFNIKVNT
jgi:hypothetical protein